MDRILEPENIEAIVNGLRPYIEAAVRDGVAKVMGAKVATPKPKPVLKPDRRKTKPTRFGRVMLWCPASRRGPGTGDLRMARLTHIIGTEARMQLEYAGGACDQDGKIIKQPDRAKFFGTLASDGRHRPPGEGTWWLQCPVGKATGLGAALRTWEWKPSQGDGVLWTETKQQSNGNAATSVQLGLVTSKGKV